MAESRRVRDMALCAVCTALVALCAQIMLPLPPIPVNLTLFAVHLTSALLDTRRAVSVTVVYLAMGLAGMPVFAGLNGGAGVLAGPTGGFLLGYPLCALTESWLMRRFPHRIWLAMACGTLVCCLCGTIWFCLLTGTEPAAALSVCVLPFLPGDAGKILLASLISHRLRHALHLHAGA